MFIFSKQHCFGNEKRLLGFGSGGASCYKDKKILPDPKMGDFLYEIWVKGKKPLLISCGREGGELYGAIFFL